MARQLDKKSDEGLGKKLQDLGLSEKEARVYLALLPRPETGTSALIRVTGLHGQLVYDALAQLESRGLARHAVERGRKKFSANSPSRIVTMLKEAELTAAALARELRERFVGASEQSFEVFQGQSAAAAHELQALETAPEGSVIDVLGPGGDAYRELMADSFEEYEKRRISKNIAVRYLSSGGSSGFLGSGTFSRRYFKYSTLPGTASGFAETHILQDEITFIFFGDPLLSFAFKNEKIAAGYRQFFEMLWNIRPN